METKEQRSQPGWLGGTFRCALPWNNRAMRFSTFQEVHLEVTGYLDLWEILSKSLRTKKNE